ncbi:MAG: hypothetical protein QGF67_13945 [Lentisphaeria bacterium]|nr:hypothetical protein [Lentisphaeria bacterium]MDP7742540.1 hypothetical protein [Lentisphaeria bacterium]
MNKDEQYESTDPESTLDPAIAKALIMPDEEIDYPGDETWNNLGQVVLEKAVSAGNPEKRPTPMPLLMKAGWWTAVAAAVVLIAAIWPRQAAGPVDQQASELQNDSTTQQAGTDWAEAAGFLSVAEEDLAVLDALEWQAELDILMLDLEIAGIVNTDDAAALDALLEGYGINTEDRVSSYLEQF